MQSTPTYLKPCISTCTELLKIHCHLRYPSQMVDKLVRTSCAVPDNPIVFNIAQAPFTHRWARGCAFFNLALNSALRGIVRLLPNTARGMALCRH